MKNLIYRGFTLIELMVVISILLISATLASINWAAPIKRIQADIFSGAVTDTLTQARLTAINNNSRMVLCPSKNRLRCDRDWRNPWILFGDNNHNQIVDNYEVITETVYPDPEKFIIKVKPANKFYFAWLPQGRTQGNPGSISICSQQFPEANRKITLSMLGRVSQSIDRNKDGQHEDNSGKQVQCQ